MKIFSLLIMVTISLSFWPFGNIYSQFQWEQLPGLNGGYVEVLASNSSGEIFAGTSTAGIFKSTDNGNSWVEKNNGLTTDNVISLALNNAEDIFAGTFDSGMFRSTDNGESWDQINSGLTLMNIRSIVIDNDSGYVFACAGPNPFSGGVFRSSNNGDNWTPVNAGLPFGAIFSLGIDSGNNMYAGSGFGAGVYISTNNGDNWSASGLTNQTVLSLTIDKINNIIYAGTYTDVLKSTDGGSTWSSTGLSGNIWALTTTITGEVFAGTWSGSIYSSSDNGNSWNNLTNELTIVQDILIKPNGDIFAATAGPGILHSTDNGNHWVNKSAGLGILNINSVNTAPNGSIFAGAGMIYRSLDNGGSWSYVKGGRGNSWYNSIVTNSQGIVFGANAGLSGGYWIYRSTDNGANWSRINNGVTDSTIWTVVVDSMDNMFIGTNGGVFKSTDNGDTWVPINSGLTSNKVHALILKNNNTIFAGTYPSGLFRSTDGGNNWISVLNGISGSNWLSFTIDSMGTIYTGSASGGSGVFKSTNNGESWVEADSGIADLNILTLAASGNDIFAGTETAGVFHSSDNGQIWISMNEGLQTIDKINNLYIDDNYIYAGTKGLWRRMLNQTVPLAPTNLFAIADTFTVDLSWDDNSDNELGFKIERKDDSLSVPGTWTLIDSVGANETAYTDTGLTPNTVYSYKVYAYNGAGNSISDSVQTVTIIPVELISFTASVSGNKVSLNWSTATEINNRGFDIERQSTNQPINQSSQWEKVGYAAGFGTTTEPKSYKFTDDKATAGKYSYRLKQIDFNGAFKYSNEIEVNVELPLQFSLSQNYPNPFNPSTQIEYSIPKDGFVKLTVYNTLGQKVSDLVNGIEKAGQHEITFNGTGLASGVYFYKLESGSNVSVKKLMLMK